jgi:hypothetical protein
MEFIVASDLIKHCLCVLGNIHSFGSWTMTPRGLICAVDAPPDCMSNAISSTTSSMTCKVQLGLLCFMDYRVELKGTDLSPHQDSSQRVSFKHIQIPLCFGALLSHSQFPRHAAIMAVTVSNETFKNTSHDHAIHSKEASPQQHHAAATAAAALPTELQTYTDPMATSMCIQILPQQSLHNASDAENNTQCTLACNKFDVPVSDYRGVAQSTALPALILSMASPNVVYHAGILIRTKEFLAAVYDVCQFHDTTCSVQIKKRLSGGPSEQLCLSFIASHTIDMTQPPCNVSTSIYGCSVTPWACMDAHDKNAAWEFGPGYVMKLQKQLMTNNVNTERPTTSDHITPRHLSIRNLFKTVPCERVSDYVACFVLDDGLLCIFFLTGFAMLPKIPYAAFSNSHNQRLSSDICPYVSTDSYVRYFIKFI